MKRNDVLKVLNIVLAVLFLNQVLTALLHGSLSGEAYRCGAWRRRGTLCDRRNRTSHIELELG